MNKFMLFASLMFATFASYAARIQIRSATASGCLV